jgi:hypothetical protein
MMDTCKILNEEFGIPAEFAIVDMDRDNPEYEELLDQHVRYGGDSEDPKEALIFCRRKGPNNSKLFVAGHYADGSNYIAFGEGWHDVPPRRGL